MIEETTLERLADIGVKTLEDVLKLADENRRGQEQAGAR